MKAVAKVSKDLYPRESLEAAAALAQGARVSLAAAGSDWRVSLERRSGAEAALDALLNEALSHAYRQRVVLFHRELSAPLASVLLARRFSEVPADPLEMMEPDVSTSRAQELEAIKSAAGKLPWD